MRSEPSERIDLRIMQVWKISGLLRAFLLGAVGYALAALLVRSLSWQPWLAWLPIAAAVVYGGLEVTVLPRWEPALVLPLLGGLWGFWVYRSAGWGLQDNLLAVRSRTLTRTTFIVPNRKVQSFSVRSTPWQRRAGMCSFHLDLASQASLGLAGIYEDDAETLTNWFQN